MSGPVAFFHERYIHRRRVDVLANCLAERLGRDCSVLDVGCGDGKLGARIAQLRPDLTVRGIDVLVRDSTAIPVEAFDGERIPHEDDRFDAVMLVDVLHHTISPATLLREATRVAADRVLIKDHYLQGLAAKATLSFMDHVSNTRHGIEIPCNYLTPSQWDDLYRQVDVAVVDSNERLRLYPPPLSWIFERHLHFIATLQQRREASKP